MITDWIVTGCWLFFSLAIGFDIISTAICSWKLATERKTKCQRGNNYLFWFSYMVHIFCCVRSRSHMSRYFLTWNFFSLLLFIMPPHLVYSNHFCPFRQIHFNLYTHANTIASVAEGVLYDVWFLFLLLSHLILAWGDSPITILNLWL